MAIRPVNNGGDLRVSSELDQCDSCPGHDGTDHACFTIKSYPNPFALRSAAQVARLEGLDIAALSVLRDIRLRRIPQDERGKRLSSSDHPI
jgi:hypothetical protein